MKRIYLDYASMTPTDPAVLKVMNKYYSSQYANPSSLYSEGVNAKGALNEFRDKCAKFLNAHKDEIFFTSGGTESNNLAILGVADHALAQGKSYKDLHFIASAIEHSSVMETMNELSKRGAKVDFISVGADGRVNLGELAEKITKHTVLVSMMMVNNETGVIQPIREIAKIIRKARKEKGADVIFHSDCAQAIYLDLNMDMLGIDLATIDGAKTYGPRGTGLLYIRRGVMTKISPTVHGGGQESGMRSGTENLPGIAGMAHSLELIGKTRVKESARLSSLKKLFIDKLKDLEKGIRVNGGDICSPHIASVTIPGADAEFMQFELDARGVACSTKSSCLGDEDESYVLKSMGVSSSETLRFSFGRWSKREDVISATKIISSLLNR